LEAVEENAMATIDQPKPSEPKSPQPDQPPLQPGGPRISRPNTADPQRVNHQTPDSQHDKFRDDPKR
jgi:hypothetical protein